MVRKRWMAVLAGLALLPVAEVMAAPNLPDTTLPSYLTIDLIDRSNLYRAGVRNVPGSVFALGDEQLDLAILRSVEYGDVSTAPPIIPPTQTGSVISQPANQQITAVVYDLVLTQIVQTNLGADGLPFTNDSGEAYELAFGPGARQPLGGGAFTDLNADAPAGSGGVIAAFYDDTLLGTNAAPGASAIGHQGAKGALGLVPLAADGSLTMIEPYPTATDGTLLISGAFVPVSAFDILGFYGAGSLITPVSGAGAPTVLMEKYSINAVGQVTGNFRGWINFTGGDIFNINGGPQLGIYDFGGRTGSDMAVEGQLFAPSLTGVISGDAGANPWQLGSTDPVGFAMKSGVPEPMTAGLGLMGLFGLGLTVLRRRTA